MSDKQHGNSDENKKVDLSDCYKFTYSEKEFKKNDNSPYFAQVQSLIPQTEQVAKKLQMIRTKLESKIVELQQQIEKKQSQNQSKTSNENNNNNKTNPKNNLLEQDLAFCHLAISEGYILEAQSQNDTMELRNILKTGDEGRPYNVIVDIALKELPSERQQNKDKDNENNKKNNENENESKDKPNKPKNKNLNDNENNKNSSKKMTPEELEYLRIHGKPLSEKGKENNKKTIKITNGYSLPLNKNNGNTR